MDLISDNEEIATMVTTSQEKAESATKLLNENLKKAIQETRDLESAYRSVDLQLPDDCLCFFLQDLVHAGFLEAGRLNGP